MFQGLCTPGRGTFDLGFGGLDGRGRDLRDHNGIAAHFRDEFVGRLVDDRKSPVIRGSRLELKEGLQASAAV